MALPRMYSMSIRPEATARVLVADDQPDVLEALRWLLTGEGYEPEFVSSTDAVLERLRARPFDLLLMDLNYTRDTTSGREGLELIPHVRAHDPAMPIVVMTGWGPGLNGRKEWIRVFGLMRQLRATRWLAPRPPPS